MSKRMRTLVLASPFLFTTTYIGVDIHALYRVIMMSLETRSKTVPYLNANKEKIEGRVQRRFSVTINPPAIVYKTRFDDECGSVRRDAAMLYDDGKILVNIGYLNYLALDREHIHRWYSFGLSNWVQYRTLENGYSHELGHHVIAGIREKLREKKELHPSHETTAEQKMPMRTEEGCDIEERERIEDWITEEGIAEHFNYDLQGGFMGGFLKPKSLDDYVHGGWKARYEQHFDGSLDYFAAFSVMNPILRTCGTERGIITIYSSPRITREELLSPSIYQSRILQSCKT